MAEKLTPQQKMAVENRGGNLLVSAAAGSGKTKVLVDRLMSYLTDPVDPANMDDFLIITYTKAAAAELRSKISDKLTSYIADHPENKHMQQQIQRLHLAKISTVHAFCADILREYAFRLDISADFRIAEENECQELMFQVLQQILDAAYTRKLDDEAFRCFVDTQGLGRDDRQVPEIILQIYSSALCHLDPNSWLDWCLDSAKVAGKTDAGETIWGEYLIKDLKSYLSLQIEALEKCIQKANDVRGLEKPVALLSQTIQNLQSLEACNTWDAIVNHPPVEYGTLTFKKEHKGTQLAEQIKAVRTACKEGLSKKLRSFSNESATVLKHLEEAALAAQGLVDLVKEFHSEYSKLKRIRRVLDFSDIEQKMLDLLLGKNRTGYTAAVEEIASRFREIMVDEYQDSNQVQDAIFSALTHKRRNCFMVGDVKQSIYQFRLADPGIFLKKYDSFLTPEQAQTGEGRKILLSSNFRSSGGVIGAVNDVFTECMSRKVGGLRYGEAEMLREGIPHISLPDPEVSLYAIDVREDTYQEEAAFVAQKVKELLDGAHFIRQEDVLRPVTADDIVVLLRSPGSVGGEFRYALESLGIPCTMGTDVDLLQTPEVETLRAILQSIHNPLQDIPLVAALTSPVFGFSADELAKIRSKHRYTSFYKALEADGSEKSRSFLMILSALRQDARFLTVTQLIHQIFIRTGMLSIYGVMDNGDEKVDHLHSFCQIAADYETTGRKELSYFLEHLTAMEERGLSISGAVPSGTVRIMSIHKSKGLEFPVVFLSGLSRTFNLSDTQKQVLCHKELGLGLTHTNTVQRVRFPTIAKRAISLKIHEETISEELRVLYVAMTRARDRLIMTYAASKLPDRISEIACRLDLSPRPLLTGYVNCPGSWILMTALQRTEAGEFFQIAEKPECTSVRADPWDIHVVETMVAQADTVSESKQLNSLPPDLIEKMRLGLNYIYPHASATTIPSKLTATQLKGRPKDQEVSEHAENSVIAPFIFRSPASIQNAVASTQYGNALHSVMQYLDFNCCNHIESIRTDLERIISAGLITEQQASIVDIEKIYRFFQTELGQKLRSGREVLREFKFSILENAQNYYSNVNDDAILLQGVIDCALIEEEEIIVLDFKTDYISQTNLQDKIFQYSAQVQTYAKALSRIYKKPVSAAYIYFFSSEQLVCIN